MFMSFEIQEPAVAYNFPATMEEFLTFVETEEDRYEFYKGKVRMMAGATKGHSIITFNIHTKLRGIFKPKGCMTYQESVYLRIKNEDTLFLPDVTVTCNPDDFSLNTMYLENPSIIVEVLSHSTSSYDRGEKWEQYRKIPSLRYYILVSQQKPLVEVFGRPHAHSLFYFEAFEGLDAMVDLREMDIKIPMQDIYDGIDFEAMAELP
jgi:Uma2 family endonuclease